MLFEPRLRAGLLNGSITLAFRRWKRSQVVAGHRYRMGAGAGLALVSAVDVVDPATISVADANAAGFPDPAALRADLSGPAEHPVYRIQLHALAEADPRDVLSQTSSFTLEDVAELQRRLDQLDRSNAHGAWTRNTMSAIAQSPGVRAADLATQLGWDDLHAFKLHVRKLKDLGLTISLPVGYELSPRGSAYLLLPLPLGEA
jgi:hypothetical protein